jgi:hypothetical protein
MFLALLLFALFGLLSPANRGSIGTAFILLVYICVCIYIYIYVYIYMYICIHIYIYIVRLHGLVRRILFIQTVQALPWHRLFILGPLCYICIFYYLYVDSLTCAFDLSSFLCRIRFCDTLVVIFFK